MKQAAFEIANQEVEIKASRLPGPVLTYVGGKDWRLEVDYLYDDEGTVLTVPATFLFDLSSVPRPLWWLIAPFELSVTAPLLHDFFYRAGGNPESGSVQPPRVYTRREVDDLFRRVMEKEGVAGWRRAFGYSAVRIFGYWAWKRDLKETGRSS